jgi:hypothetical protein
MSKGSEQHPAQRQELENSRSLLPSCLNLKRANLLLVPKPEKADEADISKKKRSKDKRLSLI